MELIHSCDSPEPSGIAPIQLSIVSHDLLTRPQRPGYLCEAVRFRPGGLVRTLDRAAKSARIPIECYVVCAVELNHALEAVGQCGVCLKKICQRLQESLEVGRYEIAPEPMQPLREFALAIERGTSSRFTAPGDVLRLALTHEQATRWTGAAANGRQTLDEWIGQRVIPPLADVHRLEAAAARNGHTLREWVLHAALGC